MSLSHTWDEERGEWVPRELVKGVPFPEWPTNYELHKLDDEIAKAKGMEQNEDGTFVSASLEAGVLEAITHIEKVCDVQLDLAGGFDIQIQVDGAHLTRGCSQTTIAANITPSDPHLKLMVKAQSPFNLCAVAVYKGCDSNHDVLKGAFTRTLGELITIMKDKGIFLPDALRVVPLTRVIGGGDKHYVNAERGQSTCAHTFPCNKCLCPKAKFGYLEESKKYPLRTTTIACQLAHVWDVEKQGPFKCVGCKVTFTTQAQLASTRPSPTKAAAHALDHYGQRWGCTPILPIEHDDHPDCILHLLLNVVCSLVDHTLLANLLKSQEEEMLKTLHEECGVYLKAKHVKATSKSATARAPEKPNIIGREAISLLQKYETCVLKFGDLRLLSQEGLEHMHSVRKTEAKACTNHRSKLGPDAKGKNMAVGMLMQGMKADKVRQHLSKKVPLPPSDTEMRARKRIAAVPPAE
eukprot:jgi/Mesvir1/21961/Mv08200-RA.1